MSWSAWRGAAMVRPWHDPFPGIDRRAAPLNSLPAGGPKRLTGGVLVGNPPTAGCTHAARRKPGACNKASLPGLVREFGVPPSRLKPERPAGVLEFAIERERTRRPCPRHLRRLRAQYAGAILDHVAARILADNWIEDWRTMSEPGRLDLQRALIADYGRYAAGFEDITRCNRALETCERDGRWIALLRVRTQRGGVRDAHRNPG